MSEYCKDCKYVLHEDGWFCSYLQKSSGFLTSTTATGHCRNFLSNAVKTNTVHKGGAKGKCFLTSACVDYLGKENDCEELMILRHFRDNYMRKHENGKKLVEEYYQIAPIIVEKIEGSDKKEEYYEDIYQTILKCNELIKAKQNNETEKVYSTMVMKYKEEFNL